MAQPRIVVAVAAEDVAAALCTALSLEGWAVARAGTAGEAISETLETPVDAAVVQLELPGESGLAVLQHLRAAAPERHLPVVMLSPSVDPATRVESLAAGADDVLPMQVAPLELVARLKRQLAVRAQVQTLADECSRLRELSVTDGLTGLFNHRHFHERLADEFRRAVRYDDPLSLIMIDIDHFKRFNDAYGHQTGDKVLRAVAAALTGAVRETDFVARYGGEEFAVLLPNTPLAGALTVAERMSHDVRKASVEGLDAKVTASLGLSAFPGRSVHRPEHLVRTADQALYRAKAEGRNKITLYAQSLFAAATGPTPAQ
jgi:two-component system cell cycle response regulator